MHEPLLSRLKLYISRSRAIARRYFVTNGFDGALTTLGLMVGFAGSEIIELSTAINASLGAAIALFVSGISSAFLSESAERRHELKEMEHALLTDLSESDYGQASRHIPILVALINGLSPFVISLLIIMPLFIARSSADIDLSGVMPILSRIEWLQQISPFHVSIFIGLVIIFVLGILLGKLGRQFWLWSGLRTLAIALLTIFVVSLTN